MGNEVALDNRQRRPSKISNTNRLIVDPICGAPGTACGDGFDQLPCPDYQPYLVRLSGVVLVPRMPGIELCRGVTIPIQGETSLCRRSARHGDLCPYTGCALWLFSASGLVNTVICSFLYIIV